jgi:hypothetical protein
MEPLLQLNLRDDRERAKTPKPAEAKAEEQLAADAEKRLKRIAAKAAHRAATEYQQSRSILFSK